MTINKVPNSFQLLSYYHVFISYPNSTLLPTATTAKFQHYWLPHHSLGLPPTLSTLRATSLASLTPFLHWRMWACWLPHNALATISTMPQSCQHQQQWWPYVIGPHHWSNATSARFAKAAPQHRAVWSLLLPLLCLSLPKKFDNNVSTMGQCDNSHATPSTLLNPLIGGYILPVVALLMGGGVKPTYCPLWTYFQEIFFAAALLMGDGVISTCCPSFGTHFGEILSTAALSMRGGVISTCCLLHFEEISSVAALSMEGSVISTHYPLRTHLLRNAVSIVSILSCCFEFLYILYQLSLA